ncbi:hypothetical protein Acr_00g0065680 [Actinidia rufa]|uniref:Uncharacterized protein n=1 Tax=Actinidia rufa TaxID=165716 RepID=A0A7J0DQE8_9ERIC|nr:hypothetical protein Acr_00g0065680 [Actinidia rufa]
MATYASYLTMEEEETPPSAIFFGASKTNFISSRWTESSMLSLLLCEIFKSSISITSDPAPPCLAPLTGERRKIHHFASRRGSLSPPLCTHLKRSLPLIKSRAKETRFGDVAPVDTSARVSKHLLALLNHSGSSKCLCACFACLCAPVASLVHSFILYHWTHVGQHLFLSGHSPPVNIFENVSYLGQRHRPPVCMRNRTVPLPTTLFVVLFAIRTSPSHAAKASLSESVITDADADTVSEDCICIGTARGSAQIDSAPARARVRLGSRGSAREAGTGWARGTSAAACRHSPGTWGLVQACWRAWGRMGSVSGRVGQVPGAWERVARGIQSSSSSSARGVRGSDTPNFKRRVRARLNSDLESV